MRVILAGGGTGGHIYPAIAIARGLKNRFPEIKLLFIGGDRGMEASLVRREGLSFRPITVSGLERRLSWSTLVALSRVPRGLFQAWELIRGFRPNIVVGTGGYVCGPVGLAALLARVPLVLHEQNAFPGLTNRILSRGAALVMLSFPEARRFLPAGIRTEVTGLPVRPEIIARNRNEARQRLGLRTSDRLTLVVGGSRGAKTLNEAAIELVRAWQKRQDRHLILIVGSKGFLRFNQLLRQNRIDVTNLGNIRIEPFIHDMDIPLAAADLVVGRAGASFLAEVLVRGVPAVLIPYPYATNNHQEYNAKALAAQGAAVVIPDRQVTGQHLLQEVENLLNDECKLEKMRQTSLNLGKPEALDQILDLIVEVARKNDVSKSRS